MGRAAEETSFLAYGVNKKEYPMKTTDYPFGVIEKVLWTIGVEAEVIVKTNRGSFLRLWTLGRPGDFLTSQEMQGTKGAFVISAEPRSSIDSRKDPSMEFRYEDSEWLSEKGIQLPDVPAVVIGEGSSWEKKFMARTITFPGMSAVAISTIEGRMLIHTTAVLEFLEKHPPNTRIICRSTALNLIHVFLSG